jgi:hypothetical protein
LDDDDEDDSFLCGGLEEETDDIVERSKLLSRVFELFLGTRQKGMGLRIELTID